MREKKKKEWKHVFLLAFFFYFGGNLGDNRLPSFFALLSTLPLSNSRMRNCQLGLFRVAVGCKLIYRPTVSATLPSLAVHRRRGALIGRLGCQSYVEAGPSKAAGGWPRFFFVMFFFFSCFLFHGAN